MNREAFIEAWTKIHDAPPPEELPPTVIAALDALLPASSHEVWADYRLGGLSEVIEDPWPRMLVSKTPELSMRTWIIDATGLFELGSGPEGSAIVLDTVLDSDEEHRVYQLDSSGRKSSLLFDSVDGLLAWIATPQAPSKPQQDEWDAGPDGLQAALDLLWRLHPANLFQCHRLDTWPAQELELPHFDPLSPAWRRVAIAWTLAQFHNAKTVSVHPHISQQMLDDTHNELIEYLKELEEAIKNDETPAIVAELSIDDDDSIAEDALEWMVSFDDARERQETDTPTSELAEKTKALLALLQGAVKELVRLEHIEVNNTPKLVEQLLEAVLAAGSPEKTLPFLIDALLESPHVEEVYADDDELSRVLARALGMVS